MQPEIYYNPRCSKCRQALALLRDRGFEPKVTAYLETPPSKRELTAVVRKLGVDPREIIRFNEPRAKELGLSPADKRSKAAWIGLIAENPILLERPIVVSGEKAVVGRPPENILTIL